MLILLLLLPRITANTLEYDQAAGLVHACAHKHILIFLRARVRACVRANARASVRVDTRALPLVGLGVFPLGLSCVTILVHKA